MAPVFLLPSGDHFQAFEEFGSLYSAVGLNQSHGHVHPYVHQPVPLLKHLACLSHTRDHVYAFVHQPVPLLEHMTCLTHTRTLAEVNFQSSPRRRTDPSEGGAGSIFSHRCNNLSKISFCALPE